MTQHVRRIGNSQGIILPRPLLQQAGISGEVSVEVIDSAIVLRAVQNHPRAVDPTKGSEIAKNRPCVVVSPDVVN